MGRCVIAKANVETALAKQLTSKERYPPMLTPVSVFMSLGSPGAGEKTEGIESSFLDEIEANNSNQNLIPDDLRTYFPRPIRVITLFPISISHTVSVVVGAYFGH